MAVAARRLPGIRVDVAPPPAVEALPRMDVAVLVGFAATGPLHLPVAIESVAQYAAVFGPDAPLAWDEVRGERVYAHLGPAVRAFFSNGGRRCWVIRVARVSNPRRATAALAKANDFAIPGVLSLAADAITPAMAQARCEGSWSDGLRVATAMQKRTFAIDAFVPLGSPSANRFVFRTRFGLRVGDLVELEDEPGLCAYATIDAVRVAPDPSGPYEVEVTVRAAFERLLDVSSPHMSSPPLEWTGTAEVAGLGTDVAATLFPPMGAGSKARLRFDAPMPATLERGHWARWNDSGAPVWLRIDELDREPAFTGSPASMDSTQVEAVASGPAWRELGAALPVPADGVRRAHLLLLDMRIDETFASAFRLSPIGLTPTHPQAWWTSWSDADLYRPSDDAGAGPATQAVPAEVPRFPLVRAPGAQPVAWIPLGVEPLFGPALAPLPDPLTKLERDGLSLFDASLFLDPELADIATNGIAELADLIRFLRDETRCLRGLHAAWSIGVGGLFNEASLLAMPDAIHQGWEKRPLRGIPEPDPDETDTPPPWNTHRGPCTKASEEPLGEPDFSAFLDCATRRIEAPVLDGPDAPVPPGTYRLAWSEPEPGARYVLFEATQPDFDEKREVYHGFDTEYVALNPREGVYYYQVFAWVEDNSSASSNAIAVIVRADEWVQHEPGGATDEAMEPEWLAVHRAALRMAAAGGELFVALAMPRHFRTQEVLRYAARLRAVREPPGSAEPGAFDFIERRALTYGALYFPWLHSDVRTGTGRHDSIVSLAPRQPRVVPPDGVALGVLAGRASARGAWIAAANEPMKDVVALTPTIAAADWQALQDAQVNLVRADPRGFLALSADTLSLDVDLRPINVRRLLVLLRRLALRRGSTYVFEPSGPELRRAVQRGFGTLLGELFRRGAFAGRTESEAFRVVTDDTINSQADYDAGRLLVELRVAPAIPMRFISIQLAQGGERLTVTEEL